MLPPKIYENCKSKQKTVQLNNNFPAVPLCCMYQCFFLQLIQLEATAASKFCGGRFSQRVDLKPHSWTPSASTRRGRLITFKCLLLLLSYLNYKDLEDGKYSVKQEDSPKERATSFTLFTVIQSQTKYQMSFPTPSKKYIK